MKIWVLKGFSAVCTIMIEGIEFIFGDLRKIADFF